MTTTKTVVPRVFIAASILTAVLMIEIGAHTNLADGVLGVYPNDGSDQPVTTSIRISFSQAMDTSSVVSRLTFSPHLDGEYEWDGNTVIFKPSEPLAANERYEFALLEGARTRLGVSIAGTRSTSFITREPGILYLTAGDVMVRSLMLSTMEGNTRLVFSSPNGIDSFSGSPEGSRIVMSLPTTDGSADLWIVDRDGSNPVKVTACGENYCSNPVWSPDGSNIAFEQHSLADVTEGTGSRIWLLSLSDYSMQPLFVDPAQSGFDPKWSMAGGKLAYYDPDSHLITVVVLSTGEIHTFPSQLGQTGEFSPNGEQIAYADLHQVGQQFYSEIWLGTVSKNPIVIRLDNQAQDDQFPAWSPAGDSVAFGRRQIDRQFGLATQLAIYNANTSQIELITQDENLNSTGFIWDPFGRVLLMSRFELGRPDTLQELWLYDTDEKVLRFLLNGIKPRWLP